MFSSLRSQKLQEAAKNIPKLKFGIKLTESAYIDNKLHLALEGLMHYLCEFGILKIKDDFNNSVELDKEEVHIRNSIIRQLQYGEFNRINILVHTPIILLSVLKEYLKRLPKPVLYGITKREWMLLSSMLPKPTDYRDDYQIKLIYCQSRASNLLTTVKIRRRNVASVLILTLHHMAMKSGSTESIVSRLAQYLAPVLMHKKKDKYVNFTVRQNLVNCMKFVILNAPEICKWSIISLNEVFPVHKDYDMLNAETAEDALKVFNY